MYFTDSSTYHTVHVDFTVDFSVENIILLVEKYFESGCLFGVSCKVNSGLISVGGLFDQFSKVL